MSEQAPERRGTDSGGGGIKGLFTTKIGPLALWIWLVIFAGIFIAWRLYEDHQSSTSSGTTSSSDTGTPDSEVPQFVNQTYVSTTAPVQQPPPNGTSPAPTPVSSPAPKAGTPVKTGGSSEQLTRTWTSEGGSTYAQVAQRLLGNTDVSNLKPANAAAQKWVAGPYAKNHNAKMPKGLEFSYTEGTVTTKT